MEVERLVIDPQVTAMYAHVEDVTKKNPALFIPMKVGSGRLIAVACAKLSVFSASMRDPDWSTLVG